MMVGCLGDIIFQVSPTTVETISSFQWSGSASYTNHKRHLNKALPEYTGADCDKITMDVELFSASGYSPDREIERIRAHMENAKLLPLIIGMKIYGSYRWVITAYKVTAKHWSRSGSMIGATVNLTLLEYPKK